MGPFIIVSSGTDFIRGLNILRATFEGKKLFICMTSFLQETQVDIYVSQHAS